MKETGVWIGLVLLIYILASPNWGTEKHTVYGVYCSDFESSVYDCPRNLNTFKTTYLAIPETQTIIRKDESRVGKYDECTVFNAENWHCNTNDDHSGEYDQLMKSGYPYDLTDDIQKPMRRMVLRPEYTVRSISEFFRELTGSR